MGGTDGSKAASGSKSEKAGLSSDCGLKLACMKAEALVIVGHHSAVKTFPGRVHTARHTTKVCNTRSRCAKRKEAAVGGGADEWGEVVTR